MNKYIIIVIVLVLIIASGAVYRAKFVPEIEKAIVTGIERSVSIVVFENTWAFEPEFIEADQGDKIIFTITNRDDYDHGFAIDAFGISQRMPARSTIQIEFVVTQAGDFPYYCSVSCGSGIVDGEKRGHFNQVGRLHVKSVISETSGFGEAISDEDFAAEARKAAMIKEAQRKLEESNIIATAEQIEIDVENTEWQKRGNALDSLKNIDYQALYYAYPEANISGGIWVFIDSATGEVVDTFFDE